jgi:hypothetical protein
MPASRRNAQELDGVQNLVNKSNPMQAGAQRRATRQRRGPHILSTLLFLTAIGFAAFASYLYWDEQQKDKNEPTPPPAASGEYTLAQVKSALDEAGLSTDFGRTTGDADQIPGVPGQPIMANGNEVYIYIFSASDGPGAIALAEETFAKIDPEMITLTRKSSGDEIDPDKEKNVFQGSNIIAVMVGGEPEDVEKVQAAIEGLG